MAMDGGHGLGKVMLGKIVVGIITPVAGAAIVYFIFDRDEDYHKRKEATVRAWNVYLETRSTASAVLKNLSAVLDRKAAEVHENKLDEKTAMEQARMDFSRELDLTLKSLEHLKGEERVDKRLLSIVDITIQQLRDMKAVLEAWIDSIKNLPSATLTDEEFVRRLSSGYAPLERDVKEIKARDSIRFDRLHRELCAAYKETFPLKK